MAGGGDVDVTTLATLRKSTLGSFIPIRYKESKVTGRDKVMVLQASLRLDDNIMLAPCSISTPTSFAWNCLAHRGGIDVAV